MRVTIFCGGTGSNNLTEALVRRGYSVTKLLNLYDDGKSTGVLRRAYDTLGPSDLRKAFISLLDPEHPVYTEVKTIFGERGSYSSQKELEENVKRMSYLQQMHSGVGDDIDTRRIRERFSIWLWSLYEDLTSKKRKLDSFEDMSVGNFLLMGAWLTLGKKWQNVADELSGLPVCKGRVVINSEEVLWLSGWDANGLVSQDEAQMVENDRDVPLVGYDLHTEYYTQRLGGIHMGTDQPYRPRLTQRAEDSITNSDWLIFPSGTYYSSLLPTYDSRGFKEAVQASRAKLIWISNLVEDKDTPGLTAQDLHKLTYERVGRVFDLLVCNKGEEPNSVMWGDWGDGSLPVDVIKNLLIDDIALKSDTSGEKHDGDKLLDVIEQAFEVVG